MASDNILKTFIEHKRRELLQASTGLPKRQRPLRDFRAALARAGTRFIMECKRSSPSAGSLRKDLSLRELIAAYSHVADAVSVLTDQRFFGGSLDDLAAVAANMDVPVLRKDFILDPFQVREAYAFGADAVLLMLSVLDDNGWKNCAAEAKRLGLAVLTEVHDDVELERALALGATIIGINNRSFHDLSVNLDVTRRLAPRVPEDRVLVCESGIRDHADVVALANSVDAFLVGSSLMRAPRIEIAARELVHGEIKICGLTRPEDALAAWQAGACWGGLVFAPHSPRRVSTERAKTIAAASPLPLVGVFVDEAIPMIESAVRELSLAVVQLHGDEDEAYIGTLRAQLPNDCRIWKAVRAGESAISSADRLLFDSTTPGSGRRFDWSTLPAPNFMRHHGLAGGIHTGNVREALVTGAGLLDVSSGVESAPGIKSGEKLQQLFAALRVATGKRENSNVPA